MATTQADIASQLKAALKVSIPELDTSVGTPMGKIVDAFAGTLQNAYVDNFLQTYTYDIDSKTGADLDQFVQLFGISRLPAKRASGTVTFTRDSSNLTAIVYLPINTQVTSATETPVTVQTVTGGVINPGVISVSVPVLAVDAGPAGNIGPNLLTNIATPVSGVTAVTNVVATSGGLDQETDSALRARWKATVFRNLAGTESMYLGIAQSDPDCFAANVVTATKQVREELQVVSGTATSTVNDAKYVWGTPVTFGTDIDDGDVFIPNHDYSFNPVTPPSITVNNASAIPNGTVADLMYQYTPIMSRNDPANGIINRIDVWCGGTRAVAATQSVVFNSVKTFTNSGTYPIGNFVRPDNTPPQVSNAFVPLAFGPIISVSPTITIGPITYGLATPAHPLGTSSGGVTYAYQIVHDNTANGWTSQSLFGLEWYAGDFPPNLSVFSMGADGLYTYNQVPSSVQAQIDSWRLAGTDARAHQAQQVLLKFNLAVMYERSAYPAQVNQAMDTALSSWLNSLGFGATGNAVVQISDVIDVLHDVPGVDNVRFLNGSDFSGFTVVGANSYTVAIQQVGTSGTVIQTYVDASGRAKDIIFTDSQVPQFGASLYVQKAQNSFGSY